MTNNRIWPVAGVFFALLMVSVPTVRAQAQNGWRTVGSLRDAGGSDTVRVRVDRAERQVLELTYSMPGLKSAKTGRRASGREQERVLLGNAPRTGRAGEPLLPVVPANILLPKGYTVDTIRVVPRGKTKLPGTHFVEHGEKPFPLIPGARPEKTKPDPAIYNSRNPYPGKLYDFVGIQKRRGSAVLVLALHPVEYVPATGELASVGELSVSVTLKPERSGVIVRHRPDSRRPVEATVDNPDTAASYRESSRSGGGSVARGLADPSDSYAYVIVTSEELMNAAGPYALTNLLAHKQSRGLTATMVSTTDIYANYTGVDNAEKVRNFIVDAYNNWETDYVLLAGDTNVVPMRKLRCSASGEVDDLPSDLYFQCLDGPYDYDGDGLWGEPTDGEGGGDVDLAAEVYIGRASAEDTNEMANFVYKTLAYERETETAEYLHTALMCGEYLGFGGVSQYAWTSMEEIRCGSSSAGYTTAGFTNNPLFNVDTLYDTDTNTWEKADLIGKINSSTYGIINHLGHANYNYVMKFYNADADGLTNDNLIFTYSQGCIPGNFEADCVAEHLTTSTRHGMFSLVFNSRYGWGRSNSTDGPSQRFNRQFWDACFGENLIGFGELNADSHEDNLWDINGECIRWCYYESNLFGDPQTPMRGRFVEDAIYLTPFSGLSISGAEGGPFSIGSKTYYLFSTATNVSLLDWTASCTSSWVTLSATNGSLAAGEHASFVLNLNTNAEALPEGIYRDALVFLNTTTGKGSTTQDIDLVVNNPPRVSGISVQDGNTVTAGDFRVTVEFDQAMKTSTLDAADFELRGAIGGLRTPSAWSYDPDTDELTLEYPSLPDDQYTLTLFSADDRFEDADGFNLDGETPSWPIPPNLSGNGVEGGIFVVSFMSDADVFPYAGSFAPKMPFGSLIYDQSLSAYLSPATDEDRFTIVLDAGQTATILLDPAPELQPVIRLFDPSGAEIGAATASAAGVDAVLQTAPIPVTGMYTASVSSAGASTGVYAMRVILNAAQEEEELGLSTNDTIAVAQDLDAGFISTGGVLRAAVLGYAERGDLQVLYEQDFEDGLDGFTVDNAYGSGDGLWHVSAGRGDDGGHSPSQSVYYGQGEGPSGGGSYETGSANGGAILTPSISLPDTYDLTLSFNMLSETEGSRTWDNYGVDVNDGSGFKKCLSSANPSLPTGTGGAWTNVTGDLGLFRGSNVTLRFTFETFDDYLNGYEGWYVDDVRITTHAEGLPDYYSFNLATGETVTLVLTTAEEGRAGLALCDGTGTTLAEGSPGGDNVTMAVRSFAVAAAGTYYARVAGRNQAYSLLVIRGGDFDQEPNHPLSAAQDISGSRAVLGSLVTSAIGSETEPNDDGVEGMSTNDFKFANDLSGSFLQTGTGVYEAVVTGAARIGGADVFMFYAAPGDRVAFSADCMNFIRDQLVLFDRDGNWLTSNDWMDYNLRFSGFDHAGDYYLYLETLDDSDQPYTLSGTLQTTNLRYGVEDDCYSISAAASDILTIHTCTPGDGPGEFRNALDPAVELYSPEGEQVAASGDGAGDGRNVLLNYRTLMDGDYTLRVRSENGEHGEYVLRVEQEPGPILVGFREGMSYVAETGSVIVLPVWLTSATTVTVTVNYDVTGGTAIGGGTDYTFEPGLLTFPPGMTETSLTIAVTDDLETEGTETLRIVLSNAVNAVLGHYATNEVVVIDDEDPLRVQFSPAGYEVNETGALAVITIGRAGGFDGRISVEYAATNGTATPGVDFMPVTGSVVFASGQTGAVFHVPVIFDVSVEGDETVDLLLRNVGGYAVLGSPSQAVLTIHDYEFPLTNLLQNPGFETPVDTNDFADGWWDYEEDATREEWAARSGSRGGNFKGWVPFGYSYFEQTVEVPRGTYTFTLWVRREAGFNTYYLVQYIDWYDEDWNHIQDATLSYNLETIIPGDGGWHQIHITGSCTNPRLHHVSVGLECSWANPMGSPAGFQFDDAAFYGGLYTGVTALANGGFEEGLSSGDKWRGSSWYATPENRANTREPWAAHGGSWGGALYGWDSTSSRYTTVIAQNVMPGTGTYTFALWLLREKDFLLTNAELRIGWYNTNFTGKIQPDSVTNVAVPADETWHEYYLTGTCTNPDIFEVRPQLFVQHLYNTTNSDDRGLKIDDARFVRGIPDSDGDGMPDAWENGNFGGATNGMPGVDSDGDTFSNWQEYLADSHPGDPGSCLQIVSLTNPCARCIAFLCSPQRNYDIEYSTNLLGGGWQSLQSGVPGVPGVLTVTDTNDSPGIRLYRINLCVP